MRAYGDCSKDRHNVNGQFVFYTGDPKYYRSSRFDTYICHIISTLYILKKMSSPHNKKSSPPLMTPQKPKNYRHEKNSSSSRNKSGSSKKVSNKSGKKKKRTKTSKTPKTSSETKMNLQKAVNAVVARFILSWPEEIPLDSIRLFFQLEQAHWFYEDFYADKYENIPHFHSLRKFCEMIIRSSNVFTSKHRADFTKMYSAFTKYKAAVPAYGAILINSKKNKMLMAESWHNKVWGFPKGKINEGEKESAGAIREVLEEVGFDITSRIREDDYIEITSKGSSGKITKLFIVCDVPEKYNFKPRVRKEIRSVRWFSINAVANKSWRNKNSNIGDFNHIVPFVIQLKRWLRGDSSTRAKEEAEERRVAEQEKHTDTSQHVENGDMLSTGDGNSFAFNREKVMDALGF